MYRIFGYTPEFGSANQAPETKRGLLRAAHPQCRAETLINQSVLGSVRRGGALIPHSGEAVLQIKLFALHARQGRVIQRQHAEFRVANLAVQFLMMLIEAAK